VHDAVEVIEPTSGRLVDGGVATIIHSGGVSVLTEFGSKNEARQQA
jgi:hypothetical protein